MSEIYKSEDLVPFLADRLAEVDALLSFVVDAARSATTYEQFADKLNKEIGQVQITQAVDVDRWLADQEAGYVIVTESSEGEKDYLRDDNTALPQLFVTPEDAFKALPAGFDLVRIVDVTDPQGRVVRHRT